jgi:hypothetical protein
MYTFFQKKIRQKYLKEIEGLGTPQIIKSIF